MVSKFEYLLCFLFLLRFFYVSCYALNICVLGFYPTSRFIDPWFCFMLNEIQSLFKRKLMFPVTIGEIKVMKRRVFYLFIIFILKHYPEE